jgi:hypothetical protein
MTNFTETVLASLVLLIGVSIFTPSAIAQEQSDGQGEPDGEQAQGMRPPRPDGESSGDTQIRRGTSDGQQSDRPPRGQSGYGSSDMQQGNGPPDRQRGGGPPDRQRDAGPPDRQRGNGPPDRQRDAGQQGRGHQAYNIEQAVSDQAQLHTIAFNGLAFITGGFGASTFIPPGKVSDFFGFQYMRDIDAVGAGHNPKFLDRVAGNVLKTLDDNQRQLFAREAESEASKLRDLAVRRFPLIYAFHKQLSGQIPNGSTGLNEKAVVRYTGELFASDAALAYQRAQVFGRIASELNGEQKAALRRMRFGDFNSWPQVDMEQYKLGRGTDKLINVAYMTLASEFFSWWAGSQEADTYFCPERHGTYFGGFYLKDMPAMGKRDYNISTSLTGDLGESFLQSLSAKQRAIMTTIPNRQRESLAEIITVRKAISAELRCFLKGQTADRNKVLALGRRYGELDGELAYIYATAFAKVGQSLTSEQKQTLSRLRNDSEYTPAPAYIYSAPLSEQPRLEGYEKLFFPI